MEAEPESDMGPGFENSLLYTAYSTYLHQSITVCFEDSGHPCCNPVWSPFCCTTWSIPRPANEHGLQELNATVETAGGGHTLIHLSALVALNQACFTAAKGKVKWLLLLFQPVCTCSEHIDLKTPLGPNLSLWDSTIEEIKTFQQAAVGETWEKGTSFHMKISSKSWLFSEEQSNIYILWGLIAALCNLYSVYIHDIFINLLCAQTWTNRICAIKGLLHGRCVLFLFKKKTGFISFKWNQKQIIFYGLTWSSSIMQPMVPNVFEMSSCL